MSSINDKDYISFQVVVCKIRIWERKMPTIFYKIYFVGFVYYREMLQA